MMLKCQMKTKIAKRGNYGNERNAADIKYIVIHYTGNDGDTDEGNGNYFANNIVKASAHYFVDDDSITQSVPDTYTAWSVGGKPYPDIIHTGGGKFHGKCTNANSISVELCDTVRDGKSGFTEATLDNAAELVRALMKKYSVDYNHVIRHFDVTGKDCPEPFVRDYNAWIHFKEKLIGDDDMGMTDIEKEKMRQIDESLSNLYNIVQGLADKQKVYNSIDEVPDWGKAAVKRYIDSGKLRGDENGRLRLDENMVRLLMILG